MIYKKKREMMEIISYPIKNIRYRDLIKYVNIDLSLCFDNEEKNGVLIPKITFLFYINSSEGTTPISGVDVTNSYLLYLVVNEHKKCVSSQSNALILYFSFLCTIGMRWDEMPSRAYKRPTYQFKKFLESLYQQDPSSESYRAGSTCKSYIRNIVNFYKFQILNGKKFSYPPFIYEEVNMWFKSSGSFIKSSNCRKIETTDLRLNVAKNNSTHGVVNKLRALSTGEWKALSAILQKTKRILRNIDGELVEGSLAIEFRYIFLIMRYSGLRRKEALSLNESVIFKPNKAQLENGYVQFIIGPENNIKTKNDKNREVEMPSLLMLKLYEHLSTIRYIKRRNKYLDRNELESFIPIFISRSGNTYSDSSLNARWTELRRALSLELGYKVHHKAHNLRATYAVFRLFALIDAGIPQSKALSILQSFMGHSGLSTTLEYLKQINEHANGDERAEYVLNYLFDLSDEIMG